MPQKNLALEALRKLLNDEVKIRNARNAIEAMKFSDMLQKTINRYQNRSIDTAEAMQELMRLAREMEQSKQRGDELGMSDQELAFYDALLAVDSVREAMDHERIRAVVHDVVIAVQRSATLDWSKSGQRQAKLRSAVRRALINHKITDSDTRDNLVELIFEQALRIAA
jgi:type I restriction enzyme R subunit